MRRLLHKSKCQKCGKILKAEEKKLGNLCKACAKSGKEDKFAEQNPSDKRNKHTK
jgi:DNA-directed RNA polymerase subunit M/transcription elongation factor TFIIS